MTAAENAVLSYPIPDYDKEPRIIEFTEKLNGIRASVTFTPDEKVASLKARQEELRASNGRALAVIAQANLQGEIDSRITDLEKQQREYGDRVSSIEALIMLAEKFIADRCTALEDSINDLFPTVRWKLFDIQINGGLVDTCTCMIPCDGALVAYSCANTAAQVNADIEISSVLSRHYGVTAPLFLDNAERVNYIASPAGQLITLSVSKDTAMRVEHKNKEAA